MKAHAKQFVSACELTADELDQIAGGIGFPIGLLSGLGGQNLDGKVDNILLDMNFDGNEDWPGR